MKKILIAGPQKKPIDLNTVKGHLRITADETSQDAIIEGHLLTAIERVEDETGRALITQTWDLVFDSWDDLIWKDKLCGIKRALPFGFCQAVESITYLDPDKQSQTVETGLYEVSGAGTDADAKIVFPSGSGFAYPDLYEVDPVTVRVKVGYGDNPAKIPNRLKTAIKIIVSDLFDDEDHEETIMSVINTFETLEFFK